MRKRIIILSLLAAISGQLLAEEYGYMVFTLNDGSTQSIAAKELSMSFTGGNLTAKSGTSTLTIPLTDLKSMIFSNDEASGIGQVDSKTTDNVTGIYNLQGHKVTKEHLRKGVYMVKTQNGTHKMTIK